jgi:hypothetical protein
MLTHSNSQQLGGVTKSPEVIFVSDATWTRPANRGKGRTARKTLSHAEMLAMAKKSPPPQEWHEEDTTRLRRPQN